MNFPIRAFPPPSMISVASQTSSLMAILGAVVPASAAWPTANKAFYIPFALEVTANIQKVWVANGATASNNFDVGVYTEDGTKLYSTGSVAQSGTNTLQTVTPTAFLLNPGRYYIGMAMNGTTGTVFRYGVTAQGLSTMGILTQTSAFALPAVATFASASAETYVPLFGLATVSTV